MRARAVYETSNFERGQDPKKAMKIGKYSSLWGPVEDFIRDKIVQLQNYKNPLYYRFDNPEFFISEDGNSLGIYLPNGTSMSVHLLFQTFINENLFQEIDQILDMDRAVGVNINSIDYSGFPIPNEKMPFVEGKMMEIYLHGV
jgi:hypothetical protein